MGKEFRFNLEKTKEHLEKLFPDENIRNSYLNSIAECVKIASKINNTNWNVNLSNDFIRVNCGSRYILNIRNERIRVMCWRESFLQLGKEFIDEFLQNVFFHKEDTKALMASDFNPKTYEELEKIPTDILWHNSLQFNINPKLWAEKYAEKLMPSVLDFCKDCINHSSIMTQMQQAHSTGVINLINEQLEQNIAQPEYTAKEKIFLQGDTQMTDYEKKLEEIKDNLLTNRNIILTGAPGTGKTFIAKKIAREMMGCEENEICFVQFHPSYDYTDFVEGLRPKQVDGSDQIGFERKDGVFKAFCERALKNLVDSKKSVEELSKEKDIEEILESFINDAKENRTEFELIKSGNKFFISERSNEKNIFIDIPNNPKNDKVCIDFDELLLILNSNKDFFSVKDIYQFLGRKTWYQRDSYIFAIYEKLKNKITTSNSEITEKIQLKNFVFIIDEINRGEVAKIFGELFFCVDPGYRGEKGRIQTQYQNLVTSGEFQKGFFIPENVYIIGTMNDIDRSVESMDFAFRRRFSWIEVKASDTVEMLYPKYDENGELISGLEKNLADEAKRRMENLNAAISETEDLNDAYHIGASYFLKLNNYDGDFEKLWNYHIKGILQEYLRGNPTANEAMSKLEAAYFGEDGEKNF